MLEKEIKVYGSERTQEDIVNQMSKINKRIIDLDKEILEINEQIIKAKIDKAVTFFTEEN